MKKRCTGCKAVIPKKGAVLSRVWEKGKEENFIERHIGGCCVDRLPGLAW